MDNILALLARQGAVIERLTSDSRRVAPGAAFFAWPGGAADGRRYIAQAIERGCAAVLWESEGFAWDGGWKAPNAGVKDLKSQAGFLAHEFNGRPSESLWICGVTGTNGKTSCSQWLAALLSRRNEKAAVIGTLGAGFPSNLISIENTTPDALELQRLLAEFKSAGASVVAMEVSSHGLDQGRVNGVAFDCALFTNLTHDHLDYHGTMAAYAEAKARLFNAPGLAAAVLNLDDPFGAQLAKRLAARGVRTIGYGLSKSDADVSEFVFAESIEGKQVTIHSSWGRARAEIPQLGRFNVSNALGVLGCLVAKGIAFEEGVRLLEVLPQVAGRMQQIGDRPLVVVDYAHTPDALDKVLSALKPVAQARGGRLVAVFGAGGGRDKAKRPVMGSVAAARADRIVLTSDNPRGEDPQAIVEAIRDGVSGDCVVELDRAKAIDSAIGSAAAADVVLIAGKGHEAFQEIAGRRLPFSDAAVAGAALGRRGNR
ncbi:MAG: UDP-N-acetylmuramoyl-L-alanyl-D-glutamate--2,6-diaminopimelate ligase [Pseudomonadota bacterium]